MNKLTDSELIFIKEIMEFYKALPIDYNVSKDEIDKGTRIIDSIIDKSVKELKYLASERDLIGNLNGNAS